MISETSVVATSDLYVDAALVLRAGYERPSPSRGAERADGLRLLYAAAVNGLVGDPETGKTLIATAMAAEGLARGESVLWIDVDHNNYSPQWRGCVRRCELLRDAVSERQPRHARHPKMRGYVVWTAPITTATPTTSTTAPARIICPAFT